MIKLVFLLGGHDLEMEAIKRLLVDAGTAGEKCGVQIHIEDKGLPWGARLSAYADELKSYKDEKIYGIELERDLPIDQIPDSYHTIDHHNEFEDKPSSLEQVFKILLSEAGICLPMEKDLELIADNDKGFISGMIEKRANFNQIVSIRKRDRDAQGVQEKDYLLAAESIKDAETVGKDDCRLTIVKAKTGKFAAITDLLFLDSEKKSVRLDEYKRLLIYTDSELCYYGEDRDGLMGAVKKAFGLSAKDICKGGGADGFFEYHPAEGAPFTVNDIVKFVKDLHRISGNYTPWSKHIFLFPFNWSKDDDPCNPLKSLSEKDGNWKRTKLPASGIITEEDVYNELNFFYPFVHDTIYDKEGNSSNLWHFERQEADGRRLDLKYIITVKDGMDFKRYELYVKSMNLNFYSTGVGLLSIFADNYNYPGEEDVLSINQYGRRVFCPFYGDYILHNETAISLRIEGLNGGTIGETFNQPQNPNQPAGFIRNLIAEAVTPMDVNCITPVLDDRMFVMSWYRCAAHDSSSIWGFNSLLHDPRAFLYRYIFVDGSYPTCQNHRMLSNLLKDSLYTRWQKLGTLYGVSRYSFVMLTTPGCPDYLLQYFETIYLRLAELALIQRASILRFSRVLSNEAIHFSEWYGQYIAFLNNFRFPEASAQEQGIELYDLLCDQMRIKENAEYLDNQFNERQEFLELENQRLINKETSLLGWLAGMAVPVSIVSALFGFFFHDPFDHALFSFDKLHWSYWLLPGLFATILSIIITLILIPILRKAKKNNKHKTS